MRLNNAFQILCSSKRAFRDAAAPYFPFKNLVEIFAKMQE